MIQYCLPSPLTHTADESLQKKEQKYQVKEGHPSGVAVKLYHTVDLTHPHFLPYNPPQTDRNPLPPHHSILIIPPSYLKSLPTISSPASGPTLYFSAPDAIDVTQPFGAVERRIADRAITSRARRASGLLWSSISMVAVGGVLEEARLLLLVGMAVGL